MPRVSANEMRRLVKEGRAMPGRGGEPGRFPIKNRGDLSNAIRAVGRVEPDTPEERARVRRFIIQRAREMNAEGMIPETWDKRSGYLKRRR